MKFYYLACAAVSLAISGCAAKPELRPGPGIQLVEANHELPAPTPSDFADQARPYLIGPFDKLKIDVFGVEELSNEVQADASGKISVPLIGVVDAAGRSPGELAAIIEDRLRGRYVRDPAVSVNLMETVSQVVTVSGQVERPGLYPVIGKMSLMRAVARAEGLTEMARRDDVVIFRTVHGQKYAALYNLSAIRRGVYEDPEVFANDIVVVGESGTRQLFKDGLAVVPAILSPLIYLLR